MTTWPTANKATTTDIDQGTDNPNLSRVQIKKDIDNINTIIDTLAIGTPTNGSILTYDSTAGEFNTTSSQELAQAIMLFRGFPTGLGDAQDENGIYNTVDGRRNYMMQRRFKYDPYGIITDIAGDGWQLSEGTFLMNTQSEQSYYITLGGAFGSVQGPSWLGHKIMNIQDDGDSTDNYPARWDNYSSFFNDYSAPGASHAYKFTVASGEQKKFYLFADGTSRLVYSFSGSDSLQSADVVVEITKIGG